MTALGDRPAPRRVEAERYEAAVAALFARRPSKMVPGLRRIRALTSALGDPQDAYTALHVTGTNGKTSTARMATALLLAAGRRVGTFTSPHLQDVRERVLIDGASVGRAAFLRTLDALRAPLDATEHQLGEMVTFFEALTALGARCFQEAAVDVGVIEVGMGGRWDATNVHTAPVAVIGTVGLDHPELGATIAEVAGEKAGVLSDGAVAVVGPQHPDAARVIAAEGRARGARLLWVGQDVQVGSRNVVAQGQDLTIRAGARSYSVHLPLHGAHQAINAACALAAVDALLADVGGLSPQAAREGLEQVRSPGRFERFSRTSAPEVVLDGAHNPDGAHCLAEALRETAGGRYVVAILGVLGDKDVEGVVAAVCDAVDACVVTTSPCGRAAPIDQLAAAVHRNGRPVSTAAAPADAFRAAELLAGPNGLIVVTGSLYLVGAIRELLGSAIA